MDECLWCEEPLDSNDSVFCSGACAEDYQAESEELDQYYEAEFFDLEYAGE